MRSSSGVLSVIWPCRYPACAVPEQGVAPTRGVRNPQGGSMARTVNQVMTHDPRSVAPDDTLQQAARLMREVDTGALIVVENGEVTGIVTDRDIVVRAIADGRDPSSTKIAD